MKEERPFPYAIRFAITAIIAVLVIFGLGRTFMSRIMGENSSTSLPVFTNSPGICFVIDAGHGGEDAGAIASDGTLEKDLNLQISTLLKTILELNGNQVTMTRSTDTLLYDHYGNLTDYTGQKKAYDLKNRLKIAEEKENSIYVGIHMNKFVEEKYSGLQVYYSPNNDLSYKIATDVKDIVKSNLQPQNRRDVKRANSSIYILHKAQIPAILIECGFLSNEKELSLLKTEEYRRALALNLFVSLVGYGN